ncbi:signal peptidase [Neisseria dentiae]|uniref:signal peptidase n=1 Tax=Neisseria dentiae TaxID=194197 RepID=UPI0035A0F347
MLDCLLDGLRPLQNRHLRRISALCAARSLAYLLDMSALAALLRLELHPHLAVLQRSRLDSCVGVFKLG